jgi:hypothetical protein
VRGSSFSLPPGFPLSFEDLTRLRVEHIAERFEEIHVEKLEIALGLLQAICGGKAYTSAGVFMHGIGSHAVGLQQLGEADSHSHNVRTLYPGELLVNDGKPTIDIYTHRRAYITLNPYQEYAMPARAAKTASSKRDPWAAFDRYIRGAVRSALKTANAQTAAAVEKRRKWDSDYNRKVAAEAKAKAKNAASPSWRTRYLGIARDRLKWAKNGYQQHHRYAWPKDADRTLIFPEVHNSRVTDCVHVRVFDNRGVPVVRMSLTGTASFIEEMALFASKEVARRENDGTLDKAGLLIWNDSLPVSARM